MKHSRFIFVIAVLLSAVFTIQAQTNGSNFQTIFSMEDEIKKPVEIPRYVFEQIVKNGAIKPTSAAQLNEEIARLERDSKAALVNLNDDGKADLLVQGDSGANITGFWLFRNLRGKWQYMLETRALGLSIDKEKTKGYRNISISAASASVYWESTYKFNGKNYLPKICSETTMNGKKQRKKIIPCSGSVRKPYV